MVIMSMHCQKFGRAQSSAFSVILGVLTLDMVLFIGPFIEFYRSNMSLEIHDRMRPGLLFFVGLFPPPLHNICYISNFALYT